MVYMTTDMRPESLVRLYDALHVTLPGNVAVRTTTDDYHLSPALIGDLAQSLNGTIVECNSAVGSRAETAMNYQAAEDIGFTAIAPFNVLDENGSLSLPVTNGAHLTESFVGSNLENYDSMVLLTRFQSHYYAGYGGVLKSLSIGVASSEGKSWIHSSGKSKTGASGTLTQLRESAVDAASAVMDYLHGNIIYIDVIDGYSVACDCPDSLGQSDDIHAIGILASTDPVALDKACIDLVENTPHAASVAETIEAEGGMYLIDQAFERGLGNTEYEIVSID